MLATGTAVSLSGGRHFTLVTHRSAATPEAPLMTRAPTHEEAEQRFRELLEDNDLPAPDRVEYAGRSVEFYWDETRTVVVVDLDDDA
jgi:hypothetical protein